jgi:hypothetical protein
MIRTGDNKVCSAMKNQIAFEKKRDYFGQCP